MDIFYLWRGGYGATIQVKILKNQKQDWEETETGGFLHKEIPNCLLKLIKAMYC